MQLQIQQAKAQGHNNGGGSAVAMKSSFPILSKFEEGKYGTDAFLEWFERFAQNQRWPKESWAVHLTPLLTGKGLQVYSNMPTREASEYDQLKTALLKRYEVNEEGLRTKFRESKSDTGETAS